MAGNENPKRYVEIQSLLDTHDEPFVVVDNNYCILAINKAFEEAFGVTSKEISGRKCYEILHLNESAFACHEKEDKKCPYYNVFTLKQPCSCQHIYYDKLGQLVRVQIKAFPITCAMHKTLLGMSVQKFATENKRTDRKEAKLAGKSAVFTECISQLQLAAKVTMPILLAGETGTGKGLSASFIHNNSSRQEKPLITIDCTVLPENLFESEMFGYERGAFTGSVDSKKGLIELAEGGTIFLDEISEIPLSMQSKLLRLIETGEFRRVGGTKAYKVDARIICATNRNLLQRVESGHFRKDLYYRIAVFLINIPPLSERLSDIPVIAEAILNQISDITSVRYRLTMDAIASLINYNYPGNVRELRSILQIASTYSHKGLITANEIKRYAPLSESQKDAAAIQPAGSSLENFNTKAIHAMEKRHIVDSLKLFNGKRRDVAKSLGISERTLYRKMKLYDIK